MKIGILSMQRVHNYGSFLQSYALKRTLEEMGHKVIFVDLEYSPNRVITHISKRGKLRKKLKYIDKYLIKRIQYSKKNSLLNEVFLAVQKNYFNLSETICVAEHCDAVVIGSDEVFNCDPNSKWGITGQRFGEIPGVPLVFTYAASCGYSKISDVSVSDISLIRNALSNLKGISVRDNNTASFVNYFTGINPEINLDPVLVYDFKDELKAGITEGVFSRPYMLIYAYHNRISSREEIKAITDYAKKYKLRTIAIGGSLPWCNEFAVVSPFQVLGYFKMARCIVTDTFHGTVIASKYNKPFAVLVRGDNSNKLEDLIERLNITSHRVWDVNDIEDIMNMSNNYEDCNRIIRHEKKHALAYLENMVGVGTK